MERTDRRRFLERTGAIIGALALGPGPSLTVPGANERFLLGIIGPGGMGMNLLKSFASRNDVAIAHVCDPKGV